MMFSLDPYIRRLFYKYAFWAYRYKFVLLVVPLAISFALAWGLLLIADRNVDDSLYVFSPINGQWKEERKAFNRSWPLNPHRFLPGKSFETKRWLDVILRAKDDGDILRLETLNAISELNAYLVTNITVPTVDGHYQLTYRDLCLSWELQCDENGHVETLKRRKEVGRFISLAFPKGGTVDTPVYLGSVLGGVTVNGTDREIVNATTLRLIYFLLQEPPPTEVELYVSSWEKAAEDYLLHHFESSQLSMVFAKYDSLSQGLDANARHFVPNFICSLVVLVLFATGCSFTLKRRSDAVDGGAKDSDGQNRWWFFGGGIGARVDWIRSTPYLAVAGLFSAGLAIASTLGLLLYANFEYNAIVTVMPFLVLSIGVDDMFIMSSAWQRTDASRPVARRLADTLSDSAVSITITSLTDVLSFAIGCLTSLPGVWIFCSYTACAITFAYIYQLTFFVACMALLGDWENQHRHCVLLMIMPDAPIATASNDQKGMEKNDGENEKEFKQIREPSKPIESNHAHSSNCDDEGSFVKIFFHNYYGPFLLKPVTKIVAVLLLLVYLVIGFYGCFQLKEGLNPGNLVIKDHYVYAYFTRIRDFWREGPQLHVLVENPPDFASDEGRRKVMDLLERLESNEYSMDRDSTVFFYLEYLNYLESIGSGVHNSTRLWHEQMRYWLGSTGGASLWETDIVWTGENRIKAFRFQIALRNFLTPNDHKRLCAEFRAIAAEFSDLNVTVYHEYFPFADQYLMILPATARNVAICTAVMFVVALLLIPSPPSAFLIVASIASINLGVVGYMALWGVNLDCVSMIGLIMSIGFAVDLSAHISYAFVTAPGDNTQRALSALECVGWPIFQGGFSTIIGMAVLSTVDAYIITTFFKTVFLVIIFGLLHGLVFLPVLFSQFLPRHFRCFPSCMGEQTTSVKVADSGQNQTKHSDMEKQEKGPNGTGIK